MRAHLSLGLGCLLCAPALARAEDVSSEALARAYYRTGSLAFEAGRFADAAEQFARAAELSPRPALLYDLGKAYDAAHDSVRARDTYARVIREGGLPDDSQAQVGARVVVLEREIAHVRVQGGTAGAEVRIDGVLSGVTPLPSPIDVNAGKHAVVVEHAGIGRVHGTLRTEGGRVTLFDASDLVRRSERPLYKRWWLWTTIGVVVAGAATAGGILGARAVDRASVPSSMLPETMR